MKKKPIKKESKIKKLDFFNLLRKAVIPKDKNTH